MQSDDAIVSNCFVSHVAAHRGRAIEQLRGPVDMCLVSACTLRRQLNLSMVRPTPRFHYLLEDTLPSTLVAPFRAVADSIELLPPFRWPGLLTGRAHAAGADRLYSFLKLRVWTLTQFRRVLYFDPDVVWTGDPTRYLTRYGAAPHLAAAEYHGANVPRWWAQRRLRYINSGIMIVRPNRTEYDGMMRRLRELDFATEGSGRGSPGAGYSRLLSGRSKMGDQDVIRAQFVRAALGRSAALLPRRPSLSAP